MDDLDKARPVSGEIMTGGPTRGHGRGDAGERQDVSDAEYETIGAKPAPASQPSRFPEATPATGMDSLRQGLDTAASGLARGQRGGPLFWSAGLALVALAFWFSGGHALVSQAAVPAAGETLQPLRVGEVKSRVERHEGRDVLFVDGRAENHGERMLALPSIEIAVTGKDDGVMRYFLDTRGAELAPGGRYAFSSRLAAPASGVKSVSVTLKEAPR